MKLKVGSKIRELRKDRNATIENTALDAEITYRTLFEIETGITKLPDKHTLERILISLDHIKKLSYEDWSSVFSGFGYKAPILLPSEKEIKWAREYWKVVYGRLQYPAYLIDIGQRVFDWNQYAPRLLGFRYGDSQTERFRDVTTMDLIFSMVKGIVEIEDRQNYLQVFLLIVKRQLMPFEEENWYKEFVARNDSIYPEFKAIWEELSGENLKTPPQTPHIIQVTNNENGTLTFQLVALTFDDPRFVVVQWIPINDHTNRVLSEWIQEEQEKVKSRL